MAPSFASLCPSWAAIHMFEKLAQIEKSYEELTAQISSPEFMSDMSAYAKADEAASEPWRDRRKISRSQENAAKTSPEPRSWLRWPMTMKCARWRRLEIAEIEEKLPQAEEELKVLLLPQDPNDEKNVILEIRAGTGGDEATLFAAEILRMYARYAERQGWKMEILETSRHRRRRHQRSRCVIEGDNVYSKMRYESGVHRVQRVPQTEQAAAFTHRRSPSPFCPRLKKSTFRSIRTTFGSILLLISGPGGQSVNTTYSAVRLTHLPTNVVVSMQDEKSQIKNREKAMRILRARLQELEEQKQHDALSAERKSMVGAGDRSEKIRTYNFKENRVTDHRIGLTVHQLDLVMEGQLDEFIEALRRIIKPKS